MELYESKVSGIASVDNIVGIAFGFSKHEFFTVNMAPLADGISNAFFV